MIKNFFKFHPVHKKIVPKLDIFFLIRPTLFFSVWVMVLVGMYSAQIYMNNNPLWVSDFSWITLLVFIGLSFTCASAFIINQIEDAKSDNINKKLFLIGKNYFSPEKSQYISRILLACGLIISFIANWITSLFVVCIYIVWGILYNKEPYSWMKKPLLGWFSNSIVGLLLFLIGWLIVLTSQINIQIKYFDYFLVYSMLPYLLCFSSVALLTTIPDMKGDLEVEDNTFPIIYGELLTTILSLFLIIIAFLLGLKNNDPIISTATIVSLPFFFFTVFRRLDKDVLRAIRYPIFILNFFTLAIYPWLFIPLVFIYYISKYYYWHRFELHYPTFLVDND